MQQHVPLTPLTEVISSNPSRRLGVIVNAPRATLHHSRNSSSLAVLFILLFVKFTETYLPGERNDRLPAP